MINTGEAGENAACLYIEQKGYEIKERNYRAPGGEIDIIATDGEYTVFIEVKSRTALPTVSKYGRASSAVDKRKRLCFVKTVKDYQRQHPETAKCRIDVIEVYFISGIDSNNAQIKHIQSAFGQD